jgi:hypothetical protein
MMGAADDFAKFIERFLAEVPGGVEGDLEMRERISVPFMDTTARNVRHDDVSAEEIDGWFSYAAWNLWDVIANRSTEGESGLIPRQEYETIAFVQQWATYGPLLRAITDAIGVDGVIDLGRTPRREVGSKINVTRNWALPICPLLGRGITTKLDLESPGARAEDIATIVQFGRRMQHGTWGDGPGFVSGREWKQPLLDQELVDRFLADEETLDDPELRATFRQFNGTTELFGFLLHYDCRAGMSDTGPYAVPGGGFMIVRDHWLHEPAYEWASVAEGLPYCVTEAMVFRPDVPVEIAINDIGTTFATPRDYLRHLSGVAVYARDTRDTPMSELRRIDAAEMARISKHASDATLDLYKTIAAKDRDEKIRDGVKVYTREMLMPHAQAAGIWDELEVGFDELHELTQAAYPTLAGGKAAEVLAPVFLLGEGFPPVTEVAAA